MIYVGLDDTDVLNTPGTNQLAKALVQQLSDDYDCPFVLRHQLLEDSRIPFTRHNSSATLCLIAKRAVDHAVLFDRVTGFLRDRAAKGSDPGICLAQNVPHDVRDFGRRCQREITDQQAARRLAQRSGLRLEGIAGTQDGVIGALAAVGLAASGSDGRIVMIDGRDEVARVQPIASLLEQGIECRCQHSGQSVRHGLVDVGKHLRPSYRQHRAVLFVQPAAGDCASPDLWTAVRLP